MTRLKSLRFIGGLFALLALTAFTDQVMARAYAEAAPKCEIPGNPTRWRTAYCMAAKGTDDVESEVVHQCVRNLKVSKFTDECAEVQYWKKKWCGLWVRQGVVKSVPVCLADPKMLPNGVAEGF